MLRVLLFCFSLLFLFFNVLYSKSINLPKTKNFKSYWYGYGAEISRYQLTFSRYGVPREGNAILIFVTEDFLPNQQVKAEIFNSRKKSIPILKLNSIHRFETGVYDYSIMQSIFTPILFSQTKASTYKVTTTVQDWCGHVFSQLNLQKEFYKGTVFSYFEKEGDKQFYLKKALLEEELWMKIRINPKALPEGEFECIPSSLTSTIRHMTPKVLKAKATLSIEKVDKQSLYRYTIEYLFIPRKLSIYFTQGFPYHIISWEEIQELSFRKKKILAKTKAVRTHALMLDYWNHNSLKDEKIRSKLGLKSPF